MSEQVEKAVRVLIIEDSPIFQKLLKIKLEECGYQTCIAVDGLQGFRAARKRRPDLIILDMMLPGIDGQQVCRLIKGDKTLQPIPLMMLTSRDSDEFARLAKEGRADVFIGKTTRIEIVMEVIQKL